MIPFTAWFDVLFALAGYLSAAGLTLIWVHRTDQTRVPKTAETTRGVLWRWAWIFAFVLLVCYLGNISLVVAIPILLLISGVVLVVLGDVFAAALWLAQQYVLGFPDRDEVVLTPQESTFDQGSQRASKYAGQTAIACAALKPSGHVVIDGARVAATSESGDYVAPESVVLVTGVRNGMLVVRCVEDADDRQPAV